MSVNLTLKTVRSDFENAAGKMRTLFGIHRAIVTDPNQTGLFSADFEEQFGEANGEQRRLQDVLKFADEAFLDVVADEVRIFCNNVQRLWNMFSDCQWNWALDQAEAGQKELGVLMANPIFKALVRFVDPDFRDRSMSLSATFGRVLKAHRAQYRNQENPERGFYSPKAVAQMAKDAKADLIKLSENFYAMTDLKPSLFFSNGTGVHLDATGRTLEEIITMTDEHLAGINMTAEMIADFRQIFPAPTPVAV
ncbi:hypothetical protein A2X44_00330 [candidate division CPR3 bacterium GWF2_35_18]|uniref:Uncharacterized protein n=1 Tax=candidate division CPR3 bacterium GW2011_GWF2_35_18 TaxID=1618350 RepID=A0A0G0E481_UNCC3|nr:MAG: hypothetical protein UR67_C0001G0049 [candidate division CPR3 bacterium GW2011_GWF2_35_18]OGB63360.1 MAG: hypothetical protein A2X44_00330 [candidate division CPR3 bacterium GWF2_35_18]OGB65572.1 MAG: hypothetical protein A2250_02185 [candidate division CPR3 bacterium RIFOXYA2_FULL_35_13]